MADAIDIKKLFESGAYFGHKTSAPTGDAPCSVSRFFIRNIPVAGLLKFSRECLKLTRYRYVLFIRRCSHLASRTQPSSLASRPSSLREADTLITSLNRLLPLSARGSSLPSGLFTGDELRQKKNKKTPLARIPGPLKGSGAVVQNFRQ